MKGRGTYQNFNLDKFKEMLSDLHKPYTADRNVTLLTGRGGMETFAYAMDIQNNLDFAQFLCDRKVLSEEEKDVVQAMLRSEDRENHEVARQILENKKKIIGL